MFCFHSFTCTVFLATVIAETVFFPLHVLPSFVVDWMIIRSWVYFWAFCPVSLICMSVLVPGPYCFDYCRYIVQPEVREHESSSSVLLSQDCFGYLGSFVFPYKYKFFSMKNIIDNLIGVCIESRLSWVVWSLTMFSILEKWLFVGNVLCPPFLSLGPR